MTQHAETVPQEAEQHSISTSLDPVIERDELEPLVAQWNDQRLGSRVREKAKTDVETTIIRELRERFDLVEGAIQHLRKRGPRENRGVAKLAAFSLEEHWFQYMRMELQQNASHDGIAFTRRRRLIVVRLLQRLAISCSKLQRNFGLPLSFMTMKNSSARR